MMTNTAPKKRVELTDEEWFEVFDTLYATGVVQNLEGRVSQFLQEHTNAPQDIIKTYLEIRKMSGV